jgi:methyl-accepting chemotaxis protein
MQQANDAGRKQPRRWSAAPNPRCAASAPDSGEVAQNVQSIADAIREQDAAIQQVAANIERIAQMTEENSAAAAASRGDRAASSTGWPVRLRGAVARYRV